MSTGTFSGKQKEDAEFIKQIYDTGVEAVVLIPAIIVSIEADDQELMNSFEGLLKQTGSIPLGIYECPGPYHRLIPPAILDKPNFWSLFPPVEFDDIQNHFFIEWVRCRIHCKDRKRRNSFNTILT